jgi:hypothetical protein
VAGGVYAELPRTAEIAAVQVLQRDTSGPDAVGTHDARTAVGPAPAPPQHPSISPSPLPAVQGTAVGTRPALSAAAVRDRVYSFLDSQVGVEDYTDASDGDDPYLQWLTAQGLGLDAEVVAPHVREWCRQAAARRDPYLSDTRPFDPWPAEEQFIPPNHRSGRP